MARPGFSFLICPDSALLLEQLEGMLLKYAPLQGAWLRRSFWGDEEPGEEFWNLLAQDGLFGEERVIICRQAHNWPAATWKTISAALGRPHQRSWPILCLEGSWEKGKYKLPAWIMKTRCLAFAEKQGWVWSMPALSGSSLQKYVMAQADRLGVAFTGKAASLFLASAIPDASSIKNELEKLALAAADGQITEQMLSRDFCNPESDAFSCARKLMAGDLAGAWQEIERADPSSLLFFLVGVLARECRQLWELALGREPRMNPREISSKKALAAKLGTSGISSAFCMLADAEFNVKSGRQTPAQALEGLCANINALVLRQ